MIPALQTDKDFEAIASQPIASPVGWKQALRYAMSERLFTADPKPRLSRTSFLRLAMTDLSDQPKGETLALPDGYQLGFRHYRAAGGGRAAAVLIHGSAGHAGQFHALARMIAKNHEMDVFAVDMRGHGAHALRRGHDIHDPNLLCADLRAFLLALHAKFPKLILGGHSNGGGLVLRMIETGIDPLISGYLFLAPYLGLGSATIQPHFGGWVNVNLGLFRAIFLANLFGVERFNDKTVLSFDLSACPDSWRYTPRWSFNMMLAFGPDIWKPKALPITRDKPVLALAGLNDQCFFPQAYGEAFACLAPQAEVRLVENCGHWDLLAAPEAAGLVTNWLDHMMDGQKVRQTSLASGRSA